MTAAKVDAVLAAAIASSKAERVEDSRRILLWRVAVLAVTLTSWELLSPALLDPFFFSSPSAIVAALRDLHTSGRLADNLGYTVYEAVVGYAIGATLAIVAAMIVGPVPRLYAIVEPFILAIYSVPSIAMAPLLIVWFGVGVTAKVLLAAYFVFFIVFMNAVAGIRGVNRGWIDTARVMGARKHQLLLKIVLRGAAPNVVAGLRLAVPEAVIGAVVGEFISSQKGIGYLILSASAKYQTAGVFAAVLVLAVLVLVIVTGLNTASLRHAETRR